MLIVDPTFTPPAPPAVLTAPDGIVSAKVDAANAGVLLKADFSAAADLPERVRFVRGDGLVVRSGDPAWAPGGIAVAYDHEARPGQANSYYAVPIYPDDSEGDASQTVAVGLPDLSTVRDLWLKNPVMPDLSMRVWVEETPEVTRPARTQFADVIGSSVPLSTWDVRSGRSTSLVVVTSSASEAAALDALLDSGVLLVQTRLEYDFPAAYWLPGDWQRSRAGIMSSGYSRWTVPLSEVRRPSTTGAPLMIPGLSYDSTDAQYASYEDRAAQVPSYLALLGW